MPEMKKHLIGSLDDSSGGSSGGVTLAEVNALIKTHNENLNAHSKQTYEEDVTTMSSIWTIQHNLNAEWYKLSITCIDSNSNMLIGEIDETVSTNNLVVIKFDKQYTGKVVIKK